MKNKFLALVLLAIASVFVNINSASAVCPSPLSWDYPNIPYNGEFTRTMPANAAGCVITYKYCWRTTPGYYDYVITDITYSGACGPYYNDVKALLDAIAVDLVQVDPWGAVGSIPPCPTLSPSVWRQGAPSCYAEYWDPWTLEGSAIPCVEYSDASYCWFSYQYCWKYNPTTGKNELEPHVVAQGTSNNPCSGTGGPYDTPCNYICD